MREVAKRIHEKTKLDAKSYLGGEHTLIEDLLLLEDNAVGTELGYSSLFTYCTRELGFSDSQAGYFNSVVQKARVVPELKEALVKGTVSPSKARYILPIISETSDPKRWIELAKTATQKVIEAQVKKEKPDPIPKEQTKRLSEDRYLLRLSLTNEEKALLDRVKELTKENSLEATFTKVLTDFIKHHDPIEKAKRAKPSHSLKRATHHIPAASQHEVTTRDNAQCTFVAEGGRRCDAKRYLQVHHLRHREHGGGHEATNLQTLCFRHHRYVHAQVTAAW
jgi:HNH endonuclease